MSANPTFTVVFGRCGSGYDARIPALPGCVAEGRTLSEARHLIQEAACARIDHVGHEPKHVDFVELWDEPA